MPRVREILQIIGYDGTDKENSESMVKRRVSDGNLSMLFLRLNTPGGYFFSGDAVDMRSGEVAIRLYGCFPVRAIVTR